MSSRETLSTVLRVVGIELTYQSTRTRLGYIYLIPATVVAP